MYSRIIEVFTLLPSTRSITNTPGATNPDVEVRGTVVSMAVRLPLSVVEKALFEATDQSFALKMIKLNL